MTDRWLDVLNCDTARMVCQGPGRRYSMARMRQQINKLIIEIQQRGNTTWILYDEDGFQFVCALFALLLTGRQVIVPASRSKLVIASLVESNFGLIGFYKELADQYDIEVSREIEESGLDSPIERSSDWGSIAFSTSGSTGKSKLIEKSADQLFLEVDNFNRLWQPKPNSMFIPLVPHYHIYGLAFGFLLPLVARGNFYLSRKGGLLGALEPVACIPGSEGSEVVVVTSPTISRQADQMLALAEVGSLVKNSRPIPISRVFCAGGKLTDANAGKMIALFDCSITEIFGSTETGAIATRTHGEANRVDWSNRWRLFPGIYASPIKEKIDKNSELEGIGTMSVWGGHVGGSESDPVSTGDQVKFYTEDQFELIGRNQIISKIEGKRVSLSQVAEILEACDLIDEAVVVALQKKNREILCCAIVLSAKGRSKFSFFGKTATDKAVKLYLQEFLDPVVVPRTIRFIDQMPRNDMGKLNREEVTTLLRDPSPSTLPLVRETSVSRGKIEIQIQIPIDLSYFQGHFEHRPIVPGIVLLNWVYHYVSGHWNLLLDPAVVNRLKFNNPATPGENLTLTVTRVGNSVEFIYVNEGLSKFASGQIPIVSNPAND